MALTVFTEAEQYVGPITINRERPFSYSVQGTFTAGSVLVLERSIAAEDTYRTVRTFSSAAGVPVEADVMAARGWKYRIRCSSFQATDAPSAEIVMV